MGNNLGLKFVKQMLNIRNVVMIINSMNVEDWQDIIGFVVNCELPFYPFMCVK